MKINNLSPIGLICYRNYPLYDLLDTSVISLSLSPSFSLFLPLSLSLSLSFSISLSLSFTLSLSASFSPTISINLTRAIQLLYSFVSVRCITGAPNHISNKCNPDGILPANLFIAVPYLILISSLTLLIPCFRLIRGSLTSYDRGTVHLSATTL